MLLPISTLVTLLICVNPSLTIINNPSVTSGKSVARTPENFVILQTMSKDDFQNTMKNLGCNMTTGADFSSMAAETLNALSNSPWDNLIYSKYPDRLSIQWHSWGKLNSCETVFGPIADNLSEHFLWKKDDFLYYEFYQNSQLYNLVIRRTPDTSTGELVWWEQLIVYGPLQKP